MELNLNKIFRVAASKMEPDFDAVFAAQRRAAREYAELYIQCFDLYVLSVEVQQATRRQREALEALVKSMTGSKEISPELKAVLVYAAKDIYHQAIREWFVASIIQVPALFEDKQFIDDVLEFDELYGFPPSKLSEVVIDNKNFEATYEAFSDKRADFRYVPEQGGGFGADHGVRKHQIVPIKGEPFLEMPVEAVPENKEGWTWWNLGVAKDLEEGASMQHCGNTHPPDLDEEGDRIISLRKPVGSRGKYCNPALTFILNRGWLGQMKGRNNEKPAPKYHPYISALLQDPRIKGLFGGGHDDTGNFHFNELNDTQVAKVREKNPDLIQSWETSSAGQKREAVKYFPEKFWNKELHIPKSIVEAVRGERKLSDEDVEELLEDSDNYRNALLYLGDAADPAKINKLVNKAIEDDWQWTAKNISDMLTPENKKTLVERIISAEPDEVFGQCDHLLDAETKTAYINGNVGVYPFWYMDKDHPDRFAMLTDEQRASCIDHGMDDSEPTMVSEHWDKIPPRKREGAKRRTREAQGNQWMLQYAPHVLSEQDIKLMMEGLVERKKWEFLIGKVAGRIPPNLVKDVVEGAIKNGRYNEELVGAALQEREEKRLKVDDQDFAKIIEQAMTTNDINAVHTIEVAGTRLRIMPELKESVIKHMINNEAEQAMRMGPQFLRANLSTEQLNAIVEQGISEDSTLAITHISEIMNEDQKKQCVKRIAAHNTDWLMESEPLQEGLVQRYMDESEKKKLTHDWIARNPSRRLGLKWDSLEPDDRQNILKQTLEDDASEGPRLWMDLVDKVEAGSEERKLLLEALLKENKGWAKNNVWDSLTDDEKKNFVDAIIKQYPLWLLENREYSDVLTEEQNAELIKGAMNSEEGPERGFVSLFAKMMTSRQMFSPEQRAEILKWGLTLNLPDRHNIRQRLYDFVRSDGYPEDERLAAFQILYKGFPELAIERFPEFATPQQKEGWIDVKIEQNPVVTLLSHGDKMTPEQKAKALEMAINKDPISALREFDRELDDDGMRKALKSAIDLELFSDISDMMAWNAKLEEIATPEQKEQIKQGKIAAMRPLDLLTTPEFFSTLSEEQQDKIINDHIEEFPKSTFKYQWDNVRNEETRQQLILKITEDYPGWIMDQLKNNPEWLTRFTGEPRKTLFKIMVRNTEPTRIQELWGEYLTDDEKQSLGQPPTQAPAAEPAPAEAPPAPANEEIGDALARDLGETLENRWDEVPQEEIPGFVAQLDPAWVFEHLVEKMTPEQRVAPIDRLIETRGRQVGRVLLQNYEQYLTDEQKERIRNMPAPREASTECAYCRKPMRLFEDRGVMYCPHCRRELAVEVDRQRFNDDSATRETLGDEVAQRNAPSQYEAKFDMSQYQTRVPGDLF